MKKKCGNCRKYNTFYTKAYCEFLRADFGYCGKEKKVMSCNEVCDCWKVRVGLHRNITRPIVLNALEKGLTDIAAIKQIFSEDDDSTRS